MGKHAFAEQLVAAGVHHVFGNPGTTEQALIDVLQDYPELDLVLALHEGVAVGAAEGWARAAGWPAFVLLHTAPGLGNAMGMLANASLGHTPMVVYVGDMPRTGRFQEPALSGPIVEMARPVSRWVHEVRTADEIPQVLRRAFKVAMQEPRGPVVVVVPADVMDEPTEAPILPPSYVTPALTVEPSALEAAADVVAGALRPAIVVADGVAASGALTEIGELADLLGAPIHQGYATEVCVMPGHPLDAGPLPLFDPAALSRRLADHDCVLAFGTEVFKQAFPDSETPLDPAVPVVHVGLDPWELAKNQPSLAIQAHPGRVAAELRRLLEARAGKEFFAERRDAEIARIREDRNRRENAARMNWDATPMTAARAVHELSMALPEDAIVADESVSASPWVQHYLRPGPGSWFRSRGGGLGAGMSIAVGLQIACPDRPVYSLVGDGSAMYTVTALWTAAHHGLPVTWVVLNNRSYRMLKLNVLDYLGTGVSGRRFVGADLVDPSIDFVHLANSLGVAALRVESAAAVGLALRERTSHPGPFLIELQVDGAVG
ncbi:thiamine pyrophosphate-binding protein [Streptomyces sp. NPDC057580]|uniref:thiamine pyrophosphate-binding protein n=1 Tax=Streptomyces sp. NPDC057580 TaxID=3346173 RepID=UPI0036B473F5